MRGKKRATHHVLLIAGILIALFWLVMLIELFINSHSFAVLQPKGEIASKERSLMIFTSLLSLLVVIPVFTMTFFIAWKYRAGNKSAKYTPDWDHHKVVEFAWWTIPSIIILIISVITWNSSHDLDPFKALHSNKKPITIQVIALQWKWLFIYPEQNIATVNFVEFPADTPINFEVTSDAPMNSFWIPQLGGQIYAMSGMSTHLNLMANQVGLYNGSSANISGAGFAGMKFIAKSTTDSDFEKWIESTRGMPENLDLNAYNTLAKPSQNNSAKYYSSAEPDLYDKVVMKYMAPSSGQVDEPMHMHGMGE